MFSKEITYKIEDKEYPVYIKYKDIKNIHFRIKDNAFYISCPRLTSLATLKKGLDKYGATLIERSEAETSLYTDDYIYLYGSKVPLRLPQGVINFTNYPKITYKSKEELDKKLKKMFKDIVTSRHRIYEKKMGIKKPYNVRVRSMKTRYGSNSSKTHTITYSTFLMHFEFDVIDSVIIHELAHYFVFDHSKKFYNVVYKYCPNYNAIQRRLKKRIIYD